MQTYEQIFKYSMQMEVDGYNFYMEKAEALANPTSKKIFTDLAEEEKRHYKYLEELLNKYLADGNFKEKIDDLPEYESIFEAREESEHLNETLEESDIPDLTILRTAYLIERDAKEFYDNISENVEDEDIKAVFIKLSKWEEGHETLFKSEYKRRMKEYMNFPWGG